MENEVLLEEAHDDDGNEHASQSGAASPVAFETEDPTSILRYSPLSPISRPSDVYDFCSEATSESAQYAPPNESPLLGSWTGQLWTEPSEEEPSKSRYSVVHIVVSAVSDEGNVEMKAMSSYGMAPISLGSLTKPRPESTDDADGEVHAEAANGEPVAEDDEVNSNVSGGSSNWSTLDSLLDGSGPWFSLVLIFFIDEPLQAVLRGRVSDDGQTLSGSYKQVYRSGDYSFGKGTFSFGRTPPTFYRYLPLDDVYGRPSTEAFNVDGRKDYRRLWTFALDAVREQVQRRTRACAMKFKRVVQMRWMVELVTKQQMDFLRLAPRTTFSDEDYQKMITLSSHMSVMDAAFCCSQARESVWAGWNLCW
jgi:hypothetical protein